MPLVVYFDEVGNPTLDPSDKDFPVFAIALFICDSRCYINEIVPRVNQLKFDVFGHEGVILHSRDIRKRLKGISAFSRIRRAASPSTQRSTRR